MFNPNKTWRRWHRKVNVTQKRHAVACALAATAVPALVMARGHKVENVPELPLVISDKANEITKTKEAVKLLEALGGGDDLTRVQDSRKVRAGRGKCRNRRYVMRKGPLVVHAMDKEACTKGGLAKSFRNIPGVDVAHVDRLNLLTLAPGGAIGRFTIYTESAVKRLRSLFGTLKGGSTEKKGYTLPRSIMKNTDISRIINSDQIQSVLLPKKTPIRHVKSRKNPLSNNAVLGRLCPYAPAEKRKAALAHKKGSKKQLAVKKGTEKAAELKKKHGKKARDFMRNLLEAHAPKVEEVAEEAEEEE